MLWCTCASGVIIGSVLPADSPILRVVESFVSSDKLQHFLAYAILALLPTLHEPRRVLAKFLLFTVVMGLILEFGQVLSPGRSFDLYDMLADGVGIVVGAAVGFLLRPIMLTSTVRY